MDEMYQFPCGVWIWILQNLCCCWYRCFSCSSWVCVFSCLVCMKVLILSFIKLDCIRCRCGMIGIVGIRCIGWKQWVEIFLLSVKMSCLRCFWCAMKFLMPSVIKLGCRRYFSWKRWVEIFLLSAKMNCLHCFYCAMKFIPSDIKLDCKRCFAWK